MKQTPPTELRPNCLLTRYPICFMHGLKSLFKFSNYWYGLPEMIQAHGYQIYELNARWRGPQDIRKTQFTDQIKYVLEKSPKVHLVAHSLGCLNALDIIQEPDLASKIASVTFICPPFGGTPWAHLGLVGKFFGIDLFASTNDSLTVMSAEKIFNRFVAPKGILIGSIIANPKSFPISPHIRVQHELLGTYLSRKGLDPSNDGLVPVASQRRAEKIGQIYYEFPGDHIQVIGGGTWPPSMKSGFDHFLDHCIFLAEYDLKQSN